MYRFRNIVCLVLSLALMFQQGIPVQAKEKNTDTVTYVNPFYQEFADSYEVSDMRTKRSESYALERDAETSAEYLTDDDKIAAIIRQGMVDRAGEITVYYKNTTGYDSTKFSQWMEMVFAETDNADEGDYLRSHYKKIAGDISWKEMDEGFFFEYKFTITYLTTAEQEEIVTDRIGEVLRDLGVNNSGLVDYEKIKLIYDYICENVTFDSAHVCDGDNCVLMHSAYAALMEGNAVCQGYASLLYRMLEEAGIDARFVYGTAQGVNHGWNIAKVGQRYYYLDSAWDAGDEVYSYFLKGENDFLNHEATSEFLENYPISAFEYHPGKSDRVIAFTEDEVIVTYTGDEVEFDDGLVDISEGTEDCSLDYYLDEDCTVAVDTPVDPGVYFVKAFADETDEYNFAETKSPLKVTIRPRTVANFKAANAASGIQLIWSKRAEADGYIVYRRTASTSHKEIKKITKVSTTSFTDTNISQGTKYYYNIVAYVKAENGETVKGAMRSNASQIVRTKITSVTNQSGSVKIKWTKVPSAAGYKVYRKASGYDSYELIKTIKSGTTISYTDTSSKSIRNGKVSYYYVVPYYSKSSSVVLKTNTKTNYYVTHPTFSALDTSGSGALKATWKKNAAASGYQVRYSLNSDMSEAKTVSISKSTLSKKISGLKKNKTYYVQVRAYKTVNDVKYYSAWSAKKSKRTKS